jgi:uncharacterized protein (DUF4415 family)
MKIDPTADVRTRAGLARVEAERNLFRLQMDLDEQLQRQRVRKGCPPGWRDVDDENPTRPRRVRVSLRIDKDVARWFWQQGDGYQARMNAVLRAFMLAKRAELV